MTGYFKDMITLERKNERFYHNFVEKLSYTIIISTTEYAKHSKQ